MSAPLSRVWARLLPLAGAVVCASLLLGGCGGADVGIDKKKTQVVATTSILADVVAQIAGDAAEVHGLIPAGKDPHTFEPSLRAVRDIAYADAVFTNGLLLEPQALQRTIDATTAPGVPKVELAHAAARYGFEPIPLVEDVGLDTVWLGLRIADAHPVTHSTVVRMSLEAVSGPGDVAAYITGTFGTPQVVFDSRRAVSHGRARAGFDGADAGAIVLPHNAHTHVSWAFSQPGLYELTLRSEVFDSAADERQNLNAEAASGTVFVAVGMNPQDALAKAGLKTAGLKTPAGLVYDHGHVDITAEIGAGARLVLRGDKPVADATRDVTTSTRTDFDPATTIISVPSSTLQPVPPEPEFRFLGTPGHQTYLLPQAVLGNHVHGELDPHIWHDVASVKAVAQVVRDELSAIDPQHAAVYDANATQYLAQLDATDSYVRDLIGGIAPDNRNLVTTHHGYSYLGAAYGITIAGFVTPNPAIQASPRDVMALTRTLENLHVPAVFIEPELASRANELTETARRLGIAICPIRGDSLDPPGHGPAQSYIELMRTNAESLARCLGPQAPQTP